MATMKMPCAVGSGGATVYNETLTASGSTLTIPIGFVPDVIVISEVESQWMYLYTTNAAMAKSVNRTFALNASNVVENVFSFSGTDATIANTSSGRHYDILAWKQ